MKKSTYVQIKKKIEEMEQNHAQKYIDKMYNNSVITIAQLRRLDDFIFKMNIKDYE